MIKKYSISQLKNYIVKIKFPLLDIQIMYKSKVNQEINKEMIEKIEYLKVKWANENQPCVKDKIYLR